MGPATGAPDQGVRRVVGIGDEGFQVDGKSIAGGKSGIWQSVKHGRLVDSQHGEAKRVGALSAVGVAGGESKVASTGKGCGGRQLGIASGDLYGDERISLRRPGSIGVNVVHIGGGSG